MITTLIKLLLILPKIKRKLIYILFPDLRVDITFSREIKKILKGDLLQAVDVGGAVDLQPHWYKMIEAAHFYIFEPHPASFEAIKEKYAHYISGGLFHVIPLALSGTGGPRTLFMTNTPTGSTIVTLNKDSVYISPDNGYFFPLKEMQIQTQTMAQALKDASTDIIKLDIQGAELEVLQGLGEKGISNLLCFEMEVHLQDVYLNGTKLEDVLQFARANQFELFDVRVARTSLQRKGMTSHLSQELNTEWEPAVAAKSWEFDTVFFKKPDQLLKSGHVVEIRKLIACYCVYNFFLEAAGLAVEAAERGLISKDEGENIRRSCLRMRKSMEISLKPYASLVRAQKNLHWGQYMWVTYPTT